MVSFICEACQEVLRKKALRNHYCGGYFTCIDCMKTFDSRGVHAHTSCITEEEKYYGPYAKLKQNKSNNSDSISVNNNENIKGHGKNYNSNIAINSTNACIVNCRSSTNLHSSIHNSCKSVSSSKSNPSNDCSKNNSKNNGNTTCDRIDNCVNNDSDDKFKTNLGKKKITIENTNVEKGQNEKRREGKKKTYMEEKKNPDKTISQNSDRDWTTLIAAALRKQKILLWNDLADKVIDKYKYSHSDDQRDDNHLKQVCLSKIPEKYLSTQDPFVRFVH